MIRNLVASLRRSPGAHVGVFVALVVAAMMMTTTSQLGGTSFGLRNPDDRLAAAAAAVTGDQSVRFTSGSGEDRETTVLPLTTYRRVPADLATRLASIDGVEAAVADVSIPLTFAPGEAAVAHGWSSAVLTPFELTAGSAPRDDSEVALGAALANRLGVAVGDAVRLNGSPAAPMVVSGLVEAPSGHGGLEGSTAFLSDAAAAKAYDHAGEADLVAVIAAPGRQGDVTDSVRAATDGYTVRTGDGLALAEDVGLAQQRGDLGELALGAGIPIAMVATFVVAGTVGLSVGGRRRTFALLRSVGATPGQIRRGVYAELVAIASAAALVGYALGTALTNLAIRGFVAHGLVPVGTVAWNAPWLILATIGASVVIALVAGFAAAHRASRIDPVVALQEADVERRRPGIIRLVLGLGALGGAITLTVVMANGSIGPVNQINLALSQLLAAMTAIALLGPLVVRAAELVVRLPMRLLGGPSGRLAAADLRHRPSRMASTVVAVALSISFLGTVYLVNANVIRAGHRQATERLVAGSVISAPGGLDDEVLVALGSVPGAGTTIGMYPTTVFVPMDSGWGVPAVAVTPGRLDDVLDLGVHDTLPTLAPDEIALSRLAAGSADVGDSIDAYLADGTPFTATVVALYDRGLGFGDAVISRDAAGGAHLGTSSMAQVFTQGSIQDGDIAALADRYPGLTAASASAANAEAARLDEQNSYINNMIVLLIAGLAAVTLVNTLVTATVDRRRALQLLDRVGATRRQVMAMALWQTLTTAGLGLALGIAAGGMAVLTVTKAVTGSWHLYLPATPITGVVALTIALTAAAILVPTIGILRRLDQRAM